jgi:hypothetical protein
MAFDVRLSHGCKNRRLASLRELHDVIHVRENTIATCDALRNAVVFGHAVGKTTPLTSKSRGDDYVTFAKRMRSRPGKPLRVKRRVAMTTIGIVETANAAVARITKHQTSKTLPKASEFGNSIMFIPTTQVS